MKVILLFALLLPAFDSLRAEDPFGAIEAILRREQGHRPASAAAMTLTEIEVIAFQNNPAIRAAARRIAWAETGIGPAGALDDATLMYRGWGVPFREPWNLNQAQHMFMAGQSFPGAGKRALRSQIAAEGVDAAKAALESVRREVRLNVSSAFFELLRSYDELRIHDEQVALARQSIESARIKYTVGRVPQHDVLKAQVALTRLVDHLVMLEQGGELARSRLNTLMGRNPDARIEVAGSYDAILVLPSLSALQRLALKNRPELLQAEALIRQGETRIKLAEKSYTPDYSLAAGYMLMPGGSRFRNTYMAELSVNLPWLNRGKHDAEIREARAQAASLKAEYESRTSLVFQEIQEALIRAKSAQRLAALYRDTLRVQAQSTLKSAVAAYAADRTDFLNLLDSQNTALDVEFSYFRALAEFETRRAELERASGGLLRETAEKVAP